MIKIRNAKEGDLEEVIRLENKIWEKEIRANKTKFKSRLDIFQKGFFLAFKDEELIGVSTSEIIDYNSSKCIKSWEEITSDGYINNHNPKGDTLYVVSIGAVSKSGGGSALISAQKDLAKKLNLKCLVLGSRIPGYDTYCKKNGEIKIEDYVSLKRIDKSYLDYELSFYNKNGLTLTKIIPNYMEDDKESRNYGVIMIWKNAKTKLKSLTNLL